MAKAAAFAILSVAAAAATGGALLALQAAALSSISLVSSEAARRSAKNRARAAAGERPYNNQTSRGSAEPVRFVLGRARVFGTQMAPGWSYGPDKEVWSIPFSFAGHLCDGIEDVWLGEESAGPFVATGATNTFRADVGSKFYKSVLTPKAEYRTGLAAGNNLILDGGSSVVRIDALAYTETPEGGISGSQSVTLQREVDYTVLRESGSNNLYAHLLTDQTGRQIVISYSVETGRSHFQYRAFMGLAAGERDTDLEGWSEGEWLSTDVGREMMRARFDFTWSRDVYPNGVSQPSVILRGVRTYDPRADSTNGGSGACRFNDPTTWIYNRNPALHWAWYMTWAGGGRRPFAKINWPSVMTAANVCDEAVPIYPVGSQLRYTSNGVLTTADDVRTNVGKILSAMGGSRFYSAGQWHVRAGAYVTPTIDLTEDDLAPGDIVPMPRQKRRDLFNTVTGKFIDSHDPGTFGASDAGGFWKENDLPAVTASAYVTEDGEVLEQDFEFPLTTDWRTGQRLLKLELLKHRFGMTFQASWRFGKAQRLQPGDTVRITSPTWGWTLRVFRVLDVRVTPHATVRLVLKEESADIYTYAAMEQVDLTPAPKTDLPDPRLINPLQGFSVSPGDTYTLPDGTVRGFALAQWDPIADSGVTSGGRIEIWWKRASDLDFQQYRLEPTDRIFRIEPITRDETLIVFGWVYNGSQVRSAAVSAVVTMRPDLPINAPALPRSANLLPGATFEGGILGPWGTPYGQGGTLDSQVTVQRHPNPNYYVSGTPGSVHLAINDTTAGIGRSAVWPSSIMSLTAAQRFCAYASLIGWGCDGLIAIEWLDINRQSMGVQAGGIPVAGVPVEDPVRRWNDPARYTQAPMVQARPAGARYARVLIVAGGTWSAGAKYLSIHMPYFGELAEGDTMPPFGAGPGTPVLTSQLADEAATQARSFEDATGLTLTADTWVFRDHPLLTFTAADKGKVEITVTFAVYGACPSGGSASTISAGLYLSDKRPVTERPIFTVAPGTNNSTTVTLSATVDVVKGQIIPLALRLSRTRFGLGVGSTTDRAYAISGRISNVMK